MPQTTTRRISAAIAALLLVGALGMAACGSSSNGSSASTSASAPATTTGSTTTGGTTATAPQASTATTTSSPTGKTTTTGAPPAKQTTTGGAAKTAPPTSGSSSALRQCLQKNGINLAAPVNTTQARAELQAAVAKCAALVHLGGLKPGSTVTTALAKLADCLRQNGVKVPKSSTSGGLNTSGIDTNSATYKAALAKCRSILLPSIHIPGVPGGVTTIPGAPTG